MDAPVCDREAPPRRVLVWCIQCRHFVSRETIHGCNLPHLYRAQRDAQRRQKHAELDAALI